MNQAGDGPTVARNRARQTEWYGEPLGDRFRRLLGRLDLSQAGLADVLGLSAPMLSQLMSGHRAKISNPAVYARLLHLEQLAADTGFARHTSEQRQELLAQVRATHPTTSAPDLTPGAADPVAAVHALLRATASGAELEAAARLLEGPHPGLAELLRVYGAGGTAAREHYTRVLGTGNPTDPGVRT